MSISAVERDPQLAKADASAPTLTPGFPHDLCDEVERYLAGLRFSHDPATQGLENAMRYSLLAGGKRMRPVLTLATARTIGVDHRRTLPLAAAIELIHTYTLIHDDLPAMDDDDLRRGRPTNHRVFGEGLALLAGDALFAEAFRLVLAGLNWWPPERIHAAACLLARAIATDGVAGGQYVDITGSADDHDAVVHMHRLKTGALLHASVAAVLQLAPPGPEAAAQLETYAKELGLMFQVVDDLLDVRGSSAAMGKPSGSDARNGRRTLVSEQSAEHATELADRCLANIERALAAAPFETNDLLGIARLARHRSG